MKENVMIALLVLVLFAVLFQPQINDVVTGKYTAVEQAQLGDFNRDGNVNLRDYYSFEANLDRYDPVYRKEMDLDNSGNMDTEDLALLYELVIAGEPSYEECRKSQCANSGMDIQECVDGKLMPAKSCGEGLCKWSQDGAYCYKSTFREGAGGYRKY